MSTPRVTETSPRPARVERDDFADEPTRAPRMAPYNRASQRELVRLAVLSEGAYADFHADPRSDR